MFEHKGQCSGFSIRFPNVIWSPSLNSCVNNRYHLIDILSISK